MASTKGSRRSGTVTNAKTSALAAEAADMENKLMELRRAMEQERAKRERAAEGSYWQSSGAAGVVRSKFRTSKLPSAGSTTPPAPSEAGAAGCLQPRLPSAGTSGGARAERPSHKAHSSSVPAGGPPAGLAAGGTHQVWQAPTAPRPASHQTVGAARQNGGQMGVASSELAQGTFDEADSHRSFLEALQEWRNANRGGGAVQQTCQDSSKQAEMRKAASVGCSNAAGMQTEGSGAVHTSSSRPTSAKPVTYFNRLVMNTASRAAGTAALQHGQCADVSSQSSTQAAADADRSAAPANSTDGSAPRIYALEAAMGSPAGVQQQQQCKPGSAGHSTREVRRPKGLDILEELERIERQQQTKSTGQYDSEDEEFAALLGRPSQSGRLKAAPEQPHLVVTTQQAGVGLTRGVRLPDAILLPVEDEEDEGQS